MGASPRESKYSINLSPVGVKKYPVDISIAKRRINILSNSKKIESLFYFECLIVSVVLKTVGRLQHLHCVVNADAERRGYPVVGHSAVAQELDSRKELLGLL